MPLLQTSVQFARRFVPRGWAPVVQLAARINPRLRTYQARMKGGDRLVLDLAQPMCLGYFFDGGVPHNQGLDRLMQAVLGPGSVFVDVGANVGYYSRLARKLVGPSGQVHAFEPLPSAFRLLFLNALGDGGEVGRDDGYKRLVGYKANTNVYLHPVAVGAQAGDVSFYEQTAGDTSSLAPDPNAKRVSVKMVTLDHALHDLPRLDLLKIDVEGYELEVFQGAKETLRRHLPLIEFELLESYSRSRNLTLDDYKALLEPLGYRFFWSNHRGQGPLAVSSPRSSDVIAVPERFMDRVQPS